LVSRSYFESLGLVLGLEALSLESKSVHNQDMVDEPDSAHVAVYGH